MYIKNKSNNHSFLINSSSSATETLKTLISMKINKSYCDPDHKINIIFAQILIIKVTYGQFS